MGKTSLNGCKISYLDVAFSECLCEAGTAVDLDVVLSAWPVLCRLARLAVTSGEAITGVRGGMTQYSMGNPSKYGILGLLPPSSSSSCTFTRTKSTDNT